MEKDFQEEFSVIFSGLFEDLKKKISHLRSERFKSDYEAFTMEFFFGHKMAGLLESAFGMKSVRDLLDIDPIRLLLFIIDPETDRELFSESFETLYQFFTVREMLSTLKKRNGAYRRFTVEYFFGEELTQLLGSTLGIETIPDLINVEILSLYKDLFFDISYPQREFFYEKFTHLYQLYDAFDDFYKSY